MSLQFIIADKHRPAGADALEAPRPRFRSRSRIVAGVVFIAALFIPLAGTAFHWDPVPSSENRVLARAPELPQSFNSAGFKQAERFSESFLTYFRDHFGFRNTLIRGLSLAKFHSGLAVDQNTNIIIGRDGWLFFPSEPGNLQADRNLDPFTSADLDAWQRVLEQRNQFCRDHGFPFIAVIPPDKQTVYPEFVPEQFSKLGPKSRLDQLLDRLRDTHSPVHVVDLRPALRDAKKYHRVYHKTDTHWNDYGACAAYPVILSAIRNELPGVKFTPQPMSDFIPRSTIHSGDLARYMNLYYEYNEDWLQLVRQPPFPPIVHPENPYVPVITDGDPKGPSLYMIHDSFTLYLSQFLGPHFSRVCWQWTIMFDGPRVLQFKPTVVVDEFLERTLYLPPPPNSPDVEAVHLH